MINGRQDNEWDAWAKRLTQLANEANALANISAPDTPADGSLAAAGFAIAGSIDRLADAIEEHAAAD